MSITLEPPLESALDGSLSAGCRANGAEVLTTDVLVAIAAGLAEVSPAWDPRPGESPGERHYRQLLVTPSYEAWLIYWPAGTGLELHDHGESAGAFAIVDGRLDETTLRHGQAVTRRLRAGRVSSFDTGCIHGVANRGARGATSVHVYSPPLSAMTYYARTPDGSIVAARRDAGEWGAER